MKQFLAAWKDWVIPLVTGSLFPWQQSLTRWELVPEYYEPGIHIASHVLLGFAVLVCFALSRDKKASTLRRWLALLCLAILITAAWIGYCMEELGVSWFPTGGLQTLARLSWLGSYLVASACLGASLTLATLLFLPPSRPEDSNRAA